MPKTKEPLVVQYESSSDAYTYESFWDSRAYEDRAERHLIRKLLKRYPASARWLVDIGGSFGRLIDLYSGKFKQVVIMDYATNELGKAVAPAKKSKVDLELIAGNAYHLPFIDNSQDALISIRVMHHLETPSIFFTEVERALTGGGVAIIEAANKNHLKRLLKSLVTMNFNEWRADYVDVGSTGIQDDENFHLIRNYHPSYLISQIEKSNLKLVGVKSVSWLRRTPLKQLPVSVSLSLEVIMQSLFSWTKLGPSNFYIVSKLKPSGSTKVYDSVDETIMDPANNKQLDARGLKSKRINKKSFQYLELRYPKPRV